MQRSTRTKLYESYQGPALKKLTPEEAKKFLLHHANMGDQEAKEILKLVFPTDNASKSLSCVFEGKVGGAAWLTEFVTKRT